MEYEHALLNLAMLLGCAAVAVTSALRLAARRSLGDAWYLERRVSRERKALLAGLAGLAVLALAQGLPLALPPLVLAGLLLWLQPGSTEQGLGSEGLLYAWGGHRFEDLQEWRLTGDHLRFRVRGEWAAVVVPAERREALQQMLEQRIPERQSTYRD